MINNVEHFLIAGRKFLSTTDALAKENGKYKVNVEGKLTIHGVTKDVSTTGEIHVAGENLFAKSEFNIAPADYEIIIPKLVRGKIAKELLIKVEMKYREVE